MTFIIGGVGVRRNAGSKDVGAAGRVSHHHSIAKQLRQQLNIGCLTAAGTSTGKLEQGLFKGGALGQGLDAVVEGLFAVQIGIHIGAAAEEQTVAQIGHFLGAHVAGDHGDAAGVEYGVGIGVVQLVDHPAIVGIKAANVGRNTDQGLSVQHVSLPHFMILVVFQRHGNTKGQTMQPPKTDDKPFQMWYTDWKRR